MGHGMFLKNIWSDGFPSENMPHSDKLGAYHLILERNLCTLPTMFHKCIFTDDIM